MNRVIKQFCGVIIISILLASCNLPVAPEPTNQADMIRTAAAQTVAVQMTQGITIPSPGPTLPQAPTAALPATTVPGTQPPQEPNATNTPDVKCDQAEFVSDVTIPDGTSFYPDEEFTKTWKLKNTGSCTWTTGYSLIFDHDNLMNGPTEVFLPNSVAPDETVELSVNLTSPQKTGSYRGYWMLRNAAKISFGIGDNADEPFFVDIVVEEPFFAVTNVQASISPSTYQGPCSPATLNLSANITTSRAGTVTYYWIFSDAENSATQSIEFDDSGTKTVSYALELTKAVGQHSGWVAIYIDDPNHQEFGHYEYNLTCQ